MKGPEKHRVRAIVIAGGLAYQNGGNVLQESMSGLNNSLLVASLFPAQVPTGLSNLLGERRGSGR